MKTALVLGAGGFIGSHMVNRLKKEGYWVRGVDLKRPDFSKTEADEFLLYDLRNESVVRSVMNLSEDFKFSYLPKAFSSPRPFDEIYQFAADMGGAGFVFTGENDFDIMHNSSMINLNVLDKATTERIFYSSSACMYPQQLQENAFDAQFGLKEEDAYPGNPDSEYGWEKLFSERLYLAAQRNKGTDVRIGRFHNIYGPEGTYKGGREKAPAATCRKVIDATDTVQVWGTGEQTRSFLYIDDCIDAVRKLMASEYLKPINIGSTEMVTIKRLTEMVINMSGKELSMEFIDGPIGVAGRNSNNELIEAVLRWTPKVSLQDGMYNTYQWIKEREKQS